MKRILMMFGIMALVTAACGGDDSDDSTTGDDRGTRTVEVEMVDIAFEPDTVEVTEGETVRFVFTNSGEVDHDAFIGDADAQAEHEREMRESEGGHGGHADDSDDAITVEPGEIGELTHTFDQAGSLEVGCHQPGHYEAGMKISVEVA